MKEEFLQYVWKSRKFDQKKLKTSNGLNVEVLNVGIQNSNSGPDFFNAKIRIDNQLWAGNVEIQVRSSDWYLHQHQLDVNYDNVILYVVWEDDAAIFDKNNCQIPTLELKNKIDQKLEVNHKRLVNNQNWIPCEKNLSKVGDLTLIGFKERLFVERLERKSIVIKARLAKNKNNWQETFYSLLLQSFGLKVNQEAFSLLSHELPYDIVKKVRGNLLDLESLLFGQANLLGTNSQEFYTEQLRERHKFLMKKYQLSESSIKMNFFRLRPSGFPTIRLSQFANLYHQQQHLFSKLIETHSLIDIRKLFKISTSEFWTIHYTFNKTTKKRIKQLSTTFIDSLIINAVIPIKYWYSKTKGIAINEDVLDCIAQLNAEKNNVVKRFEMLGVAVNTAVDSQSLLELKSQYCDTKSCLKCNIGIQLLNEK
ncbi:MAG: DUF2851 family protein [Flavobacteriaceae bacterium]|nr:DUF2851 family protein [Flavobacteriaceae bacterium]